MFTIGKLCTLLKSVEKNHTRASPFPICNIDITDDLTTVRWGHHSTSPRSPSNRSRAQTSVGQSDQGQLCSTGSPLHGWYGPCAGSQMP